MTEKYLRIFVALMLVGMVLAACGGGGDDETPAPTEPPAEPTKPAPTSTLSAADHAKLGMEYYEAGEMEEALAEFQTAVDLDPNDFEAYRDLGSVYTRLEKFEEAIAAYEKAIELAPDFGEAYGDMALAYISQGKVAEAMAAAEKAVELAPDYAMGYNNLAVAYGMQGQIDQAVALLKKALEVDPACADAHYNLGFAYENMGQEAEAVAEYQEAIKVNPVYADAHENLGSVYARQGQLDEAITRWQETIKIDPERGTAYKSLGMAYTQQGKLEEALAAFESYLELTPDAADRAAVEEQITALKASAVNPGEYRNVAGGYGLEYPEGWLYQEKNAQVLFAEDEATFSASTGSGQAVLFQVGVIKDMAPRLGVAETATPEQFLAALAEDLGVKQMAELETGKIQGYPAALMGISKESSYAGSLAFIAVEERGVVVYGVTPPEKWDTFSVNYVTMLNSLFFFAPE